MILWLLLNSTTSSGHQKTLLSGEVLGTLRASASPVHGPKPENAQAAASTLNGQIGFGIWTDRHVSQNTKMEIGHDGTGWQHLVPTNQTGNITLTSSDEIILKYLYDFIFSAICLNKDLELELILYMLLSKTFLLFSCVKSGEDRSGVMWRNRERRCGPEDVCCGLEHTGPCEMPVCCKWQFLNEKSRKLNFILNLNFKKLAGKNGDRGLSGQWNVALILITKELEVEHVTAAEWTVELVLTHVPVTPTLLPLSVLLPLAMMIHVPTISLLKPDGLLEF